MSDYLNRPLRTLETFRDQLNDRLSHLAETIPEWARNYKTEIEPLETMLKNVELEILERKTK